MAGAFSSAYATSFDVGSAGGAVTANLTATESADTLTSAAAVAIQATLGRTEAADTISSSAVLPIRVTVGATEAPDTLSSTASISLTSINADLVATESSDTLGATVSVSVASPNYGFHSPFSRASKKRRVDDEEDDEKGVDKVDALDVVVIGDAPKRQVVTGLVMPAARKAKAGKPEHLSKLSQASVEGERARAERIRRNIAASNAWLMTV